MMLIDRAGPTNRERAGLLSQARETYEQIGMPCHIEMTQKILDRAASR
jgi:hypothetical protein